MQVEIRNLVTAQRTTTSHRARGNLGFVSHLLPEFRKKCKTFIRFASAIAARASYTGELGGHSEHGEHC